MKTDAQRKIRVVAELKPAPSVNSAQIGIEVRDEFLALDGYYAC